MDLIERSKGGDENAFAELYHQYKNLVYKTAFLMLDDPAEAEDALQEVFLKVHRSLVSYRPDKGAFTTWLHRITVNHCLNRKRRRRWHLLSWAQVPPHQVPTHPSPEKRQSEQDAVARAIRQLSDKLRAVVVLRYYADMSYAEISQTLGLPLGTVKSRLNAAVRTLRVEMQSAVPGTLPDEEVAK